MRRLLALILLLLLPTTAWADFTVVQGAWNGTVSAAVFSGRQIQDVGIADSSTGSLLRAKVTGASWPGVGINYALSTTTPFTHVKTLRITSATTTTVLAGISAKVTRIFGGSVCVDAGGVTTAVTIEDNSASPIDVFTGTTATTPFQLAAGQCLDLRPPSAGTYTGFGTAAGKDLQIVTGSPGPINAVFYLRQE